jgi:hypothetical protein
MRIRIGFAISSVGFLAACGSDSGTTGGTTSCVVGGVSVSASPSAITTTTSSSLTATMSASSSCTGGVTWTASPTGGTLTTSGLGATFSATTPGTYTLTATSVADPSRSGSAIVTVTASTAAACGAANGTLTNHTSNITADETWAGDGITHVIPNSISITGNAVVTIQPCAIVALAQGATISVNNNAHLVAAGTSAARFVLFRRNVANQAWGTLRGVSATSLIDLTWTTLQGGGNFGGMNDPTLAAFGNGYATSPARVIRVNNVTIQGSQGVGIYLDANAGFTNDSQLLTISSSGGRPINTTMMSLGTIPIGTYTGNAQDEVLIFGPNANVFSDITIQDLGIPIRVAYGVMSVAAAVGSTGPVTLTLKPGVIFKFPKLPPNQPGMRMSFGTNGNSPNNLVGVLNAVGTAAKPIVFTSGEVTPAPGDWVGVWLNTANGSRLDFVEINYAGGASSIVSTNCRLLNTPDNAALLVGDFETQYVPANNLITNSKISNSAGYGINAMWQASIFNSVDLTATNTFTGNARCKQTYNGLTPPGVCPVGGGCTVP